MSDLPRLFGKYYLLELINVGGMAEVYRAKLSGVEGFEKIVAIKKILPEVAEDKEFIKMFIDEAKTAVRLSHPNIVNILELGKIDEAYFIAMELVNGNDLKTIRKRLKGVDLLLPVQQSAYIISRICDGLDYAHSKCDDRGNSLNIIHRDISPQNIMISYEGNIKLIDFGIAKAKTKSSKTRAGMLKGKFSYMSPEQVMGQPLDNRSDIFSTGVVLYELLTGKRLFLGKNDVETLEKIKKADVPPPSVFNSDVPPELDRIVLKSLEKDLKKRYQRCNELSDDLKQFNFQSDMKFNRQDMMNFMQEFFEDEIIEETRKIDEYRELKVPQSASDNTGHTRRMPAVQDDDDIRLEISGSSTQKKFLYYGFAVVLMLILAAAGFYIMKDRKDSAVLALDTTVKGASAVLNKDGKNSKKCETPCKFKGLNPGVHQLEVKKEGYITRKESIILKKGEVATKLVKMNKIGEIKTIMTVKSDPSGASVLINGKDTGKKTPCVLNVPVGIDIEITARKKGYQEIKQNYGEVSPNEDNEVRLVMHPERKRRRTSKSAKSGSSSGVAQKTGHISVNSVPWSRVYINGKLLKTTPITKHELPAGKHKIRFKREKFNIDKTFPITVKPNDHQRIIKRFRQY